jgi:hypothetical protein
MLPTFRQVIDFLRAQTAMICSSSVRSTPVTVTSHAQHHGLERHGEIVLQHRVEAGDALAVVVTVDGWLGDQGVQRCPLRSTHPASISCPGDRPAGPPSRTDTSGSTRVSARRDRSELAVGRRHVLIAVDHVSFGG